MPGIGEVMREIHRLQQQAHGLREQLDRIPRQLKAQQAKVAREEAALKEAQEALKRLKVTAHEKEGSLKATLGKVAKHEKQLRESTTPKEYEALQKEIAAEKAAASQLEDEILVAMSETEQRTQAMPALEAALRKAEQESADFAKSVGEREAGWKAQLQEAQTQLSQVEKEIPEKHRSNYNRLVASMGADAIAPVQGRSCGACFTEITAQSYNELQQQLFVTCKSCYRILYPSA